MTCCQTPTNSTKIYAIDFDGTLCVEDFPRIGEPKLLVIAYVKQLKAQGHKLILWTCRGGRYLQEAVDFCASHGIIFDAVNENLPERVAMYDHDSRKIGADVYIDDKAVHVSDIAYHMWSQEMLKNCEEDK